MYANFNDKNSDGSAQNEPTPKAQTLTNQGHPEYLVEMDTLYTFLGNTTHYKPKVYTVWGLWTQQLRISITQTMTASLQVPCMVLVSLALHANSIMKRCSRLILPYTSPQPRCGALSTRNCGKPRCKSLNNYANSSCGYLMKVILPVVPCWGYLIGSL